MSRDDSAITVGLMRRLDRRLSTKGEVVFPATPALERIILQRIEAIVRLVGRPFSKEELADLAEKVVLRGPTDGAVGWEDFLARAAAGPEADARASALAVSPDDLSDLIFTSGTTGHPKGVMTAHGQNLRTFAAWSELVGLRDDSLRQAEPGRQLGVVPRRAHGDRDRVVADPDLERLFHDDGVVGFVAMRAFVPDDGATSEARVSLQGGLSSPPRRSVGWSPG